MSKGVRHQFNDIFIECSLLGIGEFSQVLLVSLKVDLPLESCTIKRDDLIAVKLCSITGKMSLIMTNNEIESLWLLSKEPHPGIVEYLGNVKVTYRLKDYLAVLMEHVEGITLERYLSYGSITDVQRLDIINQLISAVEHIHKQGIIHRDIKAENIIYNQATGKLKVIDFGLSCVNRLNSEKCQISAIGTPTHLSPELWRVSTGEDPIREATSEEDLSMLFKSDIWSLGITIYHILFKDVPFDDSLSDSQVIDLILSPDPIKIPRSQIATEGIIPSLEKMLIKDWRLRSL